MSNIEIFEADENGAGFVSVDSLSVGDKVELEMTLAFGKLQNACHVCFKPIGRGNCCEAHRSAKGSIYLP